VIIALVEAGLGVGMLPGLAIHDRAVRASIHPTDPPLARRIASVIRPERRRHPMIVSALAELERFGATYEPLLGEGSDGREAGQAAPAAPTPPIAPAQAGQ
jgi:hypothetical protein